jgi:hypothetical protein
LKRTKIDPESLDQDAGLLNEAGVKMSFVQVGRGQSKPIERLWGTLHERFDKFEITYTGSNTADRPDELELYHRNIDGIKKKDAAEIPAFEEMEERLGHLFDWCNNEWHHSGQGMDERTSMEVWQEKAGPKREIPEHLTKYLFTLRHTKTVLKNGIILDGFEYYSKEMIAHIGEKVDVRVGIEHKSTVHIFSLPDRKHLFDAELNIWTGNVARGNARLKRRVSNVSWVLRGEQNLQARKGQEGPLRAAQGIEAEFPAPAGGGELERIARFFAAAPQKMRPICSRYSVFSQWRINKCLFFRRRG